MQLNRILSEEAFHLARLRGLEQFDGLGGAILRHRGQKVGTTAFTRLSYFWEW